MGRLLPPAASGALARLDDPPPEPHPAEAALVASATPPRRHEFVMARACAHAALAAVGRDCEVIPVGPRRQPVWPPGVVGSIAHGGEWVGAVVALSTDAVGLGLDIEPLDPPLPPEVERLVLTDGEKGRLPAGPGAAKVVFTAKECVYKALYPSTGWALEFSDVEVDLDLEGGRWHAVLPARPGAGMSGRFEMADGHVFTAVLVAPDDTGCR